MEVVIYLLVKMIMVLFRLLFSANTLYPWEMADCADLPLGYKFEPLKEELVGYFLKRRLRGIPLKSCYKDVILELDVYSDHPSNIMALTNRKVEDDGFQQGYFFSSLKKISKNGKRINRLIPDHGKWLEKAGTTTIYVHDDIGFHKYYKFNPLPECKGSKLNKDEWMMHEYSLPGNQDDINLVLCHITNKKDNNNKSIKARKRNMDYEAGPSKKSQVDPYTANGCADGGVYNESLTLSEDGYQRAMEQIVIQEDHDGQVIGIPAGEMAPIQAANELTWTTSSFDPYNTAVMDDVLNLISYDVGDECADGGVYNESLTLFENGYQHAMQLMQEVVAQEVHGGQVIRIPAGEMAPIQAANELTWTTSSFDPSTQEELNRLEALLMS